MSNHRTNPGRVILLERHFTAEAATHIGVDHLPLQTFAEERAGSDDVRDLLTRDFATEALEEAADARNYLVWWLQQLHRTPRTLEHRNARILIRAALGHTLAAATAITAARDLLAHADTPDAA